MTGLRSHQLKAETAVSDAPAASRRGVVGRWWFTGIGVSYLAVALAGFLPNTIAALGKGVPLPVELHIHGAIMGLFVLAFLGQATLAARGSVALHRRLGRVAFGLGILAYASMLLVLQASMRREDPEMLQFLVQVWSLGLVQSTTFLGLFVGAAMMRRKPDWHRRLMAFAMLIILQGALDRMHWLPKAPLPSFWAYGARLFPLAVPLFVFDLVSLKHVHRATLTGAGAVVVAYALLSSIWENADYHAAALALWRSVFRPV